MHNRSSNGTITGQKNVLWDRHKFSDKFLNRALIMNDLSRLVDQFRTLGGKAENIDIRLGKRGRGVFRHNPTKEGSIFIPKDLLIDISRVSIKNGRAHINSEGIERRYATFFQDYINQIIECSNYSAQFVEQEKEIENMPDDLKQYFMQENESILMQELDDYIRRNLITTRAISYQKCNVFAPVWDLVNHDMRVSTFESSSFGLKTPNCNRIKEEDEILQRYNLIASPLGRAIKYNFACQEAFVFSLPFQIEYPKIKRALKCIGNQTPGKDINKNHALNNNFRNNRMIIDALPIACLEPQFIESYFATIAKDLGSLDTLLLKIVEFNLNKRRHCLDTLYKRNNTKFTNMIIDALKIEIDMLNHQMKHIVQKLERPQPPVNEETSQKLHQDNI